MILDQAANLKLLVEQATTAANVGTRDAALGTVQDRISLAVREVRMYGVAQARWRDELPDAAGETLTRAMRALREILAPLQDASDDELAAYGSNTAPENRGGLAAIVRGKDDLLQALAAAQGALLDAWLHSLWPADQRSELEVLAHLPEGEEAAKQLLGALRTVAAEGEAAASNPIGPTRLEALKIQVENARWAASNLTQHAVPAGVVAFWRDATGQTDGVSLAQLSLEVHHWLVDHGAADQFGIFKR